MTTFALFQFTNGVWRTDGTASGTFLLVTGGQFNSANVDGSRTFFCGSSGALDDKIYTTDGTLAGTHEITPGGAWTGELGLAPSLIGVVGGRTLFSGLNSSGKESLWSTDGTNTGTFQVAVTGAAQDFSIGSVSPLYNGRIYFCAPDLTGNYQFWATDGTTKGTVEIPVAGARTNGGLDPSGLYTVLNGKLLFTGQVSDRAFVEELFATDGTSGGTVALTSDFDDGFANLGSKALFSTWSPDGSKDGLWVTDSTVAGTRRLDVSSMSRSTTYPGTFINQLTSFVGKAFFSVGDRSGGRGLWQSDGTVIGTRELHSSLFAANLVPNELEVVGRKLLFVGQDNAGRTALFSLGTNGAIARLIEASNSGLYGATPQSGIGIAAAVNNKAVVQVSSDHNGGDEVFLYLTDGTTVTKLSDVVYGSAIYIDGSGGKETLVGTGDRNFINTRDAYGSGTVTVDLRTGSVSKGGTTDATLTNIQGVQLGSDQSVILGLATGADYLYGGSGADTFYNEGATDYIQGGTGSDGVVGGAGSTVFYAQGGADHLYAGTGSITVYGRDGTEDVTAGPGSTALHGSTAVAGTAILRGGSGSDAFDGGIGTNLLYEGSGTDVFRSGGGTDYVYGGSGTSSVFGGAGTAVVTTGAGSQQVTAGTGHTSFNDTAANLTAGRFDRIDNFSGGGGTDLYLPTAVQGSTRFVAQDGGTAVLTSVNGGTAEIFASGADLAAVRTHTHFTLSR